MNRKQATRLSVIPVPSGQFTWSRNLLLKGFSGLDAELPCLCGGDQEFESFRTSH